MPNRLMRWWRQPPQWSRRVETTPRRGAVAAAAVFFVPDLMSQGIMRGFDMSPAAGVFGDGLVLNAMTLATAIASLAAVRLAYGVRLRDLVAGRPGVGQWLKWCALCAALGSVEFLASLCHGHRLHEPGFLPFMMTAVFAESVLYPVIEEPIHRVVLLVPIATMTRSRALTYLVSIALFAVSHVPSYSALLLHGTIGLGRLHIALIVSFGLLATHAYWTTGKLSLCMVMHGITNGMQYLGMVTGYLIDFPPPCR